MPAPKEVVELVERFRRNYESYKAPQYNETQVRREFIDPLFAALGWDVDNTLGYAEAYKDVVHEDSMRDAGAPRSPDYSFRIGGTRKFFVETKRPSLNLKDDPSPAYQLRRYAWSAKLPVSILTDFEEFAVYDTRIKPSDNDHASVARVDYLRGDEILEHWDERIASRFSRDAVLRGDFDRFAQPKTRKRGTTEVDDAFLEEIESWREALARNLALRNPRLEIVDLNYSVQMIIDRIVFLRIAEDRGLEDYGRLGEHLDRVGIYKRLQGLFRAADGRYNSGLFHFASERGRSSPPDDITVGLHLDDKPLKDIISRLYYPESPYEFSLIPSDILGQVYERFLGKVIRLTDGHRAVVEPKPEVRRAGGVYYTPTFIVSRIVEASLLPLLAGRKPSPAVKRRTNTADIRVCDPACGSGSFLLGAYEYLLNWHRDWYINDGPTKWARSKRPTLVEVSKNVWRLTTAERKRILLATIFGVDIDAQAVEVTKLALLLKVLEGENQQTLQTELKLFNERALPDLDQNIKRGNSLIEHDYREALGAAPMGAGTDADVHAFTWSDEFPSIMGRGGFDAVIGNPPYDVMEKDRGAASWPHTALADYVAYRSDLSPALGGKLNLFRFFVVRALSLTREGGRFGMIVPLALLGDISCANTRRSLFRSTRALVADCFPQKDNQARRVFKDAKLSTVVLTAERANITEKEASIRIRVYPWNSFGDEHKESLVRLEDTKLIDPKSAPIPLVNEDEWQLCLRIHAANGMNRLGDMSDFVVTRGEINQTVYRKYIIADGRKARMLKGVEVAPYYVRSKLSQGEREWFDEREYLRVHEPKPVVDVRRIATQRITGVDERLRVVATIIDPPAYFADSTNSVALGDGAEHALEYLLGILNSSLIQWRFKLTSTNNNVGTNELDSLPIRVINFSKPKEKSEHDQLVNLVRRATSFSEDARAATASKRASILRSLVAVENEINKAVYALYGVRPQDIAVVERTPLTNVSPSNFERTAAVA